MNTRSTPLKLAGSSLDEALDQARNAVSENSSRQNQEPRLNEQKRKSGPAEEPSQKRTKVSDASRPISAATSASTKLTVEESSSSDSDSEDEMMVGDNCFLSSKDFKTLAMSERAQLRKVKTLFENNVVSIVKSVDKAGGIKIKELY